MMDKKLKRVFFAAAAAAAVISVSLSSLVFAETADPAPETEKSDRQELTREEILEKLDRILLRRKAVREMVPGVELIGEADTGHIEYNGTPLGRLDTEALKKLLASVITEARRLQIANMERIQSQLRNIQNLNRINAHTMRTLPSVPTPYTPPRAHSTPNVPQSPPRIPPPPPRTR
jgi:hypothetical protein